MDNAAMVIASLVVLGAQVLPRGWTDLGVAIRLPSDPGVANRELPHYCVDETGKYVYRSNPLERLAPSQVPITFSVIGTGNGRAQKLQILDPTQVAPADWYGEGVIDVCYARYPVIALQTAGEMRYDWNPVWLAAKVDDPAVPITDAVQSLLAQGLTPVAPDGLPGSDYHGRGRQYNQVKFVRKGTSWIRVVVPQSVKSAHPIRNAVDWRTRTLYVGCDSDTPSASGLGLVGFGKRGAFSLFSPPGLLAPRWVASWNSCALANRTVACPVYPWRGSSSFTWLTKPLGTAVFDERSHKWETVDGLALYGASSNGRFVAYSFYPSPDLRLAAVR